MNDKPLRRQVILDLLASRPVGSQDQLRRLLDAKGLRVTQATLSRDLKDLSVFKGPSGYVLPGSGAGPGGGTLPGAGIAAAGTGALSEPLRMYLLRAEQAGNLVVLRTRPGHASPLATEFDRAQVPGVVGTIAGDDTVFLAAESTARARALVRSARQITGRSH